MSASTEAGNTRKRTLGGNKKGRPSAAAVLRAAPNTPAYNEVKAELPSVPVNEGEIRTADGGGVPSGGREGPPQKDAAASPRISESVSSSPPLPSREETPSPAVDASKAAVAASVGQAKSNRGSSTGLASSKAAEGERSREDTDADGGEDAETAHRVSVYLSGAAVRASKQTGMVRGALAIEAVDAALELGILPQLIQMRNEGERKDGSRFPPRKQSRRVNRRARGATTRVLWQPSFTPGEIKILDEVLDEAGAENRSQLISVAVEWYLGPKIPPEPQSVVNLDTGSR